MNAITPTKAGEIIEAVIAKGDIANLTPEQRAKYYVRVCESIGLNPMTRPFEYITLNGKLTLYARRDAADQLRKLNGISIEIVSRAVDEGLLTVHVRATDKSGRSDEDLGVVTVAGLKGEAAANAMLKAVTKAKRRVTLSLSGLGFLDETEVEDIPPEAKRPPRGRPEIVQSSNGRKPLPPVVGGTVNEGAPLNGNEALGEAEGVDQETGEIVETTAKSLSERLIPEIKELVDLAGCAEWMFKVSAEYGDMPPDDAKAVHQAMLVRQSEIMKSGRKSK